MPATSQVAAPSTEKPRESKRGRRKGRIPGQTGVIHRVLHRIFTGRCRTAWRRSRALLGSMLIAPTEVIGECVERISERRFYQPAHATIYAMLVEFWDEQQPADFITLTQALRDRKLLDAVGGPAFITQLVHFHAHGGEREVLPRHRPGEIRPAPDHRHLHGVRRRARTRSRARSTRCWTTWSSEVLAISEDRFKDQVPTDEGPGHGSHRNHRKTLRAARARSRACRPGSTNFDRMTSGLHAGGNDRHRRAPEHGQDGVRDEHRRARRHRWRSIPWRFSAWK